MEAKTTTEQAEQAGILLDEFDRLFNTVTAGLEAKEGWPTDYGQFAELFEERIQEKYQKGAHMRPTMSSVTHAIVRCREALADLPSMPAFENHIGGRRTT
jgi:hypothetical protein